MSLSFSHHARERMQNRGLTPDLIETIYAYGASRRRKGADVYFLDRAAREQLRSDVGPKEFARIERALNAYLVIGEDERILTCAHRKNRLKWH